MNTNGRIHGRYKDVATLEEPPVSGNSGKAGRTGAKDRLTPRNVSEAFLEALERSGGADWFYSMMNGRTAERVAALQFASKYVKEEKLQQIDHQVRITASYVTERNLIPAQAKYIKSDDVDDITQQNQGFRSLEGDKVEQSRPRVDPETGEVL